MTKYDLMRKIVVAFSRYECDCDFAIICDGDNIIIQVTDKHLAIGCRHIISITEAIHWTSPNVVIHRIVGKLITSIRKGNDND